MTARIVAVWRWASTSTTRGAMALRTFVQTVLGVLFASWAVAGWDPLAVDDVLLDDWRFAVQSGIGAAVAAYGWHFRRRGGGPAVDPPP